MPYKTTSPSVPFEKLRDRDKDFIESLIDAKGDVLKAWEAIGNDPNRKQSKLNAQAKARYLRPWIVERLREKTGGHVPEALETIAAIMRDTNVAPGTRLKAAQDLLDRAGYKAPEELIISEQPVNEMKDVEIIEEIKQITSDLQESDVH